MDTVTDITQREETSKLPVRVWAILGIVLVADIMDLLDSTITTIAAPTISARLHGGAGLIKWLGASYALSLGVLLVTGGITAVFPVADRGLSPLAAPSPQVKFGIAGVPQRPRAAATPGRRDG